MRVSPRPKPSGPPPWPSSPGPFPGRRRWKLCAYVSGSRAAHKALLSRCRRCDRQRTAGLFDRLDRGLGGADRVVRPNVALERAGLLTTGEDGTIDLTRTKVVYAPANGGLILIWTLSWLTWYPPSIFKILWRRVMYLARLMASMVASVPELQNRILSAPGSRRHSASASKNWLFSSTHTIYSPRAGFSMADRPLVCWADTCISRATSIRLRVNASVCTSWSTSGYAP